LNYYTRHIGDYLKDTSHLSLLEHGVYTRMLDVYYTRERGFVDSVEACKLLGAKTDEERAAVEMILADFFQKNPDGYEQKRAIEELERYRQKCIANQENGKKGGRPPKTGQKKNPDGFQNKPNEKRNESEINPNQQPTTNNQQPKGKSIPRGARRAIKVSLPDDFGISDPVREWAMGKGYGDLDRHLESFRQKSLAKGYTYVNWDAAFRVAIEEDWAALRKNPVGFRARASPGVSQDTIDEAGRMIFGEGYATG
jgi:uncharacterized protein YdaU (DUF1376 family)